MLELLIGIVLSVILFIISKVSTINNVVIEYLLDALPILIPTFLLWKNTPRNYLKLMSLRSRNITYNLVIKLSYCPIDDSEFEKINDVFMTDSVGEKNGRILNQSIGEHIYKSILDIDTTIIELEYFVYDEIFMVNLKDKTKYKLFFDRSEEVLNKINSIFSKRHMYYEEVLISLKIEFMDNCKKNCKNPFWDKILDGFNTKVASFKYETENDSIIEISNNKIEFLSTNLSKINEDIKKELTIFQIRN